MLACPCLTEAATAKITQIPVAIADQGVNRRSLPPRQLVKWIHGRLNAPSWPHMRDIKRRRYGFKFLQILQGKYGPAKPTCPGFIVRLGTGCNRNRQRVHEIRKGIRYESYGPRSNRRGRGRRAVNDHRDDGGLLLCRRGNWQHRRCSTAMCYGGNVHGRRAFSGHEQRDKAAISPFGAYTVSANNTETSQRENELFRSKMKDRLLLLVTGAGCAA